MTTGISLRAWRDYDDRARSLPGMDLGQRWVEQRATATALELYQQGVRRVQVNEPLDLRDPVDPQRTAALLGLVRDLTSYAIVVDWELATEGSAVPAAALTHLSPPARLDDRDGAEQLFRWRREFHLGRFGYRLGPGFVQVRDWRSGGLRRLTIDDPAYLAAIPALLDGAPMETVAPPILRSLTSAGLVAIFSGYAVWLPYRIRRWPFGTESA